MVYSGLEVGQHFASESDCDDTLLVLRSGTRMLLTLMQIQFMFLNNKVCIYHKLRPPKAFCLFIQLRTAALRLIVRSWLNVPSFATRRLHACHHARVPSGERWNCGQETSGNFAEMTTFTPFRDLLHAVNLRHGTDGFTSLPKEGVLEIFSP